MGSKCSISLINAEAVIFHQYLSKQGEEEALVGIQFGLGAFNQTISCFMINTSRLRPWELCVHHIPDCGMITLFSRPVWRSCVSHIGCAADTVVDSEAQVSSVWWPAGALDSTTFTLHNWMQCGSLQHGGLDGSGRKMVEVSNAFTSAALLFADFVLKQEYHTVYSLLPSTVKQSSVISTKSKNTW